MGSVFSRVMAVFTGKRLTLFGGRLTWEGVKTRAVDDTIRRGRSFSRFDVSSDYLSAGFSGTLVTEILGAGFASRNLFPRDVSFPLDLSAYEGLSVTCSLDSKIYSINLKDKSATARPDGRLESVIEYKVFLELGPGQEPGKVRTFFLPFTAFVPYYRGRPVSDHKDVLDRTRVQSFNVMCASLFERQKGDFGMTLFEITAVRRGLFSRIFSRL